MQNRIKKKTLKLAYNHVKCDIQKKSTEKNVKCIAAFSEESYKDIK